jgi:hypothetical protein
LASAAYLFASLFGTLLNLSRNYLIAIVATVGLGLFIVFRMDEFIENSSWLTQENSAFIFAAIAVILIIVDVRTIVKSMKASL